MRVPAVVMTVVLVAGCGSATDGIAVENLAPDLFVRPMADVASKDIPLVAVDTVPLDGSNVNTYVGNDNAGIGRMLAEEAIRLLRPGASGTVVVSTTVPGVPVLDQRAQSIKEAFAEKLPNVRVLGPFETKTEPTLNFGIWNGLVKANPDALAFLGTGDQDSYNLAKIKQENNGTYLTAGFDLNAAVRVRREMRLPDRPDHQRRRRLGQTLMMLGAQESAVLARFCELVVPGSAAIDPVSYVERLLAGASADWEDRIHAALGLVARHLDPLGRIAHTAGFQLLRTLAVEAFYGDYAPPDHEGPSGHEVIGYAPPQATRLRKDWTFLDTPCAERSVHRVERAERTVQHIRFELLARHQLWWPHRATVPRTDDDEPVTLLAGRCVGAGTVINTKVAMRAPYFDVERFAGETGSTLTRDDLLPWYERVERRCGACTTGCPTNAGRDTLNTYLAPVLARDKLRLRTHRTVTAVTLDTSAQPRVTGVRYQNPDGTTGTVTTPVVVLAAGSLGTPRILLRSNDYMALDTPSTRQVGTTLGLHPARLVYGLFDEPQDCHLVYPITAHCLTHQRDFVVEGTTIQEPVSFAGGMVDARGHPLWGADLALVTHMYRRWAGLLVMANDENTGTVELDPAGRAVVTKGFSAHERRRLDDALAFTADVPHAAGARRVVWSGLSTSHVQGTARMGADPARSVVDDRGRAHGVDGLYVGDGSVVPASLSVNPSLTIMALAAMIADNLAGEL